MPASADGGGNAVTIIDSGEEAGGLPTLRAPDRASTRGAAHVIGCGDYRPGLALARELRRPDDRAEVGALVAGELLGQHVGLDVAERRLGLVRDSVCKGLDD